jgi:hypothetical protein
MLPFRFETEWKPGWLARAVFELDAWLRRRQGIFEYSTDPHCILRLELRHLDRPVTLRDGTALPAGQDILQLHLWNEHIPAFFPHGATLHWAQHLNHCFALSLRELASFLKRQNMQSVGAVRAKMAFGTVEQVEQLLRICGYYGFRPAQQTADTNLWARLRRQGENMHVALMVLAYNPRAFRLDCLRRSRADVFLTRLALEKRFGRPRHSDNDRRCFSIQAGGERRTRGEKRSDGM